MRQKSHFPTIGCGLFTHRGASRCSNEHPAVLEAATETVIHAAQVQGIGSFAGRGDQFNKPSATFLDVESKFTYIREMGFNCIETLSASPFITS